MQAFGVLDRYIGKTIFTTIMMTLFMLVSLSGIIKFVDQLKKAGQGSYDALGAGMYTLLSVPKDVQIFFPMAALLGALLGLGMLAQRSELVVMQASGFTPPPVPEWGLLIAEGRNYLSTAWWLTTFPGVVVIAVVLATNRISQQFSGGR